MRLLIPFCSLFFVISAADASWSDIVDEDLGGGWEQVSISVAYNASTGWKYLPEADRWIYVYGETEPVPTGYVLISAGSFHMGQTVGEWGHGTSDELPRHSVTLTRDFYMRQTEVTNADVAAVFNWALDEGLVRVELSALFNNEGQQEKLLRMESYIGNKMITFDGTDLVVEAGKEDLPCINLSWFGAAAYCNYVSDMEGRNRAFSFSDWSFNLDADGYRLPLEAEWEYACRAGTETAFYTGPIADTAFADPNLDKAGWYTGNSDSANNPMDNGKGTFPGGLKQANAWDLYDMHGNVWEWCLDPEREYETNAETDPVGTSIHTDPERSVRGGAFSLTNRYCRAAERLSKGPNFSSDDIGFRPVRTAQP